MTSQHSLQHQHCCYQYACEMCRKCCPLDGNIHRYYLAHIATVLLAARSMVALAGGAACAGSDVTCAMTMQSALDAS